MKQLSLILLALMTFGCTERRASTPPPAGPVVVQTAEPGVIPPGTNLVMRTNETIRTDQAIPGRTFSATVAEPVQNARGSVLIPRGAPAELIVAQVDTGGIATEPTLQLALHSVTVGGKRYPVASAGTEVQTDEERRLGWNPRTATMVGGGALLGTVVGAIAGGGTGAAIGAVTGAAGGAAVQVLTAGDEINVPAETVVTFRTDEPIRLTGYPR